MEKIIQLPQGSPATRHTAIPYRDEAIAAFETADRIVFDLTGVESISGAFADECVGVLVKQFGYQAVAQKVRVRNGNGVADKNIAKAILDRKQECERES